MPGGGRIVLSVRDVPVESFPVEAAGQLPPGPCVEMSSRTPAPAWSPTSASACSSPSSRRRAPAWGRDSGSRPRTASSSSSEATSGARASQGAGAPSASSCRARHEHRRPSDATTTGRRSAGARRCWWSTTTPMVLDVSIRALRASGYEVLSAGGGRGRARARRRPRGPDPPAPRRRRDAGALRPRGRRAAACEEAVDVRALRLRATTNSPPRGPRRSRAAGRCSPSRSPRHRSPAGCGRSSIAVDDRSRIVRRRAASRVRCSGA